MEHAAEPPTLPGGIYGKFAENVHRLGLLRDGNIGESSSNLVPDILCLVTRAAKSIANHNIIKPACHGAEPAAWCIQCFQAFPELLWAVEWIVLLVEMTPQVQFLKRLTQPNRASGIVVYYPQLWLGHEVRSF